MTRKEWELANGIDREAERKKHQPEIITKFQLLQYFILRVFQGSSSVLCFLCAVSLLLGSPRPFACLAVVAMSLVVCKVSTKLLKQLPFRTP